MVNVMLLDEYNICPDVAGGGDFVIAIIITDDELRFFSTIARLPGLLLFV